MSGSAPSRRTVRAASIAVLPPPWIATRRPIFGRSPPISTLSRNLQRVVDFAGIPCGDLLALAQVGSDGQKHGIEPAPGFVGHEVLNSVIEHDLDTEAPDAIGPGIEHVSWQSIFRDTEVHHATSQRSAFVDDHGVAASAVAKCASSCVD